MEALAEWIDAKTTLEMVEKVLNGRGDAKRAIAECLRDGDIRSTASEWWLSNARRVQDAWNSDATKLELDLDVEIPMQVYRSSKQWGVDQEEWRWPVNNFSIVSKISPGFKRHMLAGVKINRFDVEKMILRRNPSGVGSPGKPEQWVALWFALIEIERKGLLNQTVFPTIASLTEAVLEDINEGLSPKSIKPTISQVWKKFVQGHIPVDPTEGP